MPTERQAPRERRGQPKSGYPCLACKQRIKPRTSRSPVRNAERVVVGFRHGGCTYVAPEPEATG